MIALNNMRHRLSRNEDGIAAVEFAMVATPFLILLMGGCDLGHTLFMQAVLQGTVQKAARDLTLEKGTESSQQALIDGRLRTAVRTLNGSLRDSDITISRKSYESFTKAKAAQAEDLGIGGVGVADGVCSPGETWLDRNGNDVYDSDGGSAGQGGAKDVVVFAVSVSYPRLFPTPKLIGLPRNVTLRATTVLANQPYGEQTIKTGSTIAKACT